MHRAGSLPRFNTVVPFRNAKLAKIPKRFITISLSKPNLFKTTQIPKNLYLLNSGSPYYRPFSTIKPPTIPTQQLSGLNKIVRLEILKQETPERIKSIWVNYHRNKDCIGAVIEKDTFEKLKKKAERCPMFVFPVPRGDGFVSMFCQMDTASNTCSFTSLEEFQKHKHNSEPFLTLNFYTELADSKGLVLMRGEPDLKFLKINECQYLAYVWQYYLLDEEKYKLMETFNRKPNQFNFDEVLKQMDTIPSIESPEKISIQANQPESAPTPENKS